VRKVCATQGTPGSFVADRLRLYWTQGETGTIWCVDKTGGEPRSLSEDEDWPASLVPFERFLYFSTVTQLRRVDKDGSNSDLVLGRDLPTDAPRPSAVTVDLDGNLFWIDRDRDICLTPLGGDSWTVLARDERSRGWIAVVGDFVYWLSGHDDAVRRTRKAGGGPTEVVAKGIENPEHLVSCGSNLALASFPQGEILRLHTEPLRLEVVCSNHAAVHGLAVDDGGIYWCSRTTREIVSAARGRGGPATLARTEGDPLGIAVDSDEVFWIEDGGRGVFSIPK
jgi:hypothetical protein